MATKKKYRLPVDLRNKMGRKLERTFDKIRDRYDDFVQKKLECCYDLFFMTKFVNESFKEILKWQPFVDKHHPLVKTEVHTEHDSFFKIYQMYSPVQQGTSQSGHPYYEFKLSWILLYECKVIMSEEVCSILGNKLEKLLVDNGYRYQEYKLKSSTEVSEYSFAMSNVSVNEDGVICTIRVQLDQGYVNHIRQQVKEAGGDVEDYVIMKDEIYRIKRSLHEYLSACRYLITPLTQRFEKAYSKTCSPQPYWNGENAGKSFKDLK